MDKKEEIELAKQIARIETKIDTICEYIDKNEERLKQQNLKIEQVESNVIKISSHVDKVNTVWKSITYFGIVLGFVITTILSVLKLT